MQENPLVMAGRKVYENSGCATCHSRFIRKEITELIRFLPDDYYKLDLSPEIFARIFSSEFEYSVDHRIGPDLGYLPYNAVDELYLESYIKSPHSMNSQSNMPEYSYLYSQKLRKDEIFFSQGNPDKKNGFENYVRGKALNYFLMNSKVDLLRR